MATVKQNPAIKPLNGKNLKDVLWTTLIEIRSGGIDAGAADAVASQAREIVRTAKVQLQISTLSKRPVPTELIKFNENL